VAACHNTGVVILNFDEVSVMGCKELLMEALSLKPEERFLLVEGLLKSLDEPDARLDDIWAEEAEKRLQAYREGRLQGIPMEEIFAES
jgi:putative addiction module component (TIGR02574 family)